jgi:hypothetical protein
MHCLVLAGGRLRNASSGPALAGPPRQGKLTTGRLTGRDEGGPVPPSLVRSSSTTADRRAGLSQPGPPSSIAVRTRGCSRGGAPSSTLAAASRLAPFFCRVGPRYLRSVSLTAPLKRVSGQTQDVCRRWGGDHEISNSSRLSGVGVLRFIRGAGRSAASASPSAICPASETRGGHL